MRAVFAQPLLLTSAWSPPTQSPIKTRGYSSQVGVARVYQRSVLMSGSVFSPLTLSLGHFLCVH